MPATPTAHADPNPDCSPVLGRSCALAASVTTNAPSTAEFDELSLNKNPLKPGTAARVNPYGSGKSGSSVVLMDGSSG